MLHVVSCTITVLQVISQHCA